MSLRKISLLILFTLGCAFLIRAEEKIDYLPNIHGVVRARYEADLDNDASRFQVRNTRLTVDGNIAPAIVYYVQIDACNQGKIQFLDVWGRLNFTKEFYVQAGQFTIPFGVEPVFAPATYVFNNRSFIGKQVCNFRGTGVKFSYTLPKMPLSFDLGAFNSATMEDHTVWSKHLSYSAQGKINLSNTTVTAGFETIAPYAVRMNNADLTVGWKSGRWWVQGEYMFKHYCCAPQLSDTHAWVLFTDYHFPVKWAMFNRASVQGRYDGMSNNSNGRPDAEGLITYSDAAANRITVGGTLSYFYKRVHADVRLNYEKYFYHSGTPYKKYYDNMLTAELVVRF
ncbi:MAG: OprO/OprP family phosphate-selective porin [Muribaculaceae bacterium]|nr:OprO/OprP family phosphate-selective porin [Muribaculaceae bacterium]